MCSSSSILNIDPGSGDRVQKMIMFADEEHVVGEVEEKYTGFYERYDEPDERQATMASIFLMTQVANVANKCGIDLSLGTDRGFKAVLFNPNSGNYVCVDVSEVIPQYGERQGLERQIEIYSSNGTNINAYVFYAKNEGAKRYDISTPSLFFIKRRDADIQFHRECVRSYGNSREALENIPPLFEAAFEISDTVAGDIVDPFQIMYRNDSGPSIIKKYLKEAYVDEDARVVIELGKPIAVDYRTITPATMHEYDKVLKMAREKLRADLLKDLEELANKLNVK